MRTTPTVLLAAGVLGAVVLTGCSATSTTPSTVAASTAAGSSASAPAAGGSDGVVLPVTTNPIVNTATAATLTIPYAAVEDNVDPDTGKAIEDRLQLTLVDTGTTALDGLEVYYAMTDIVTGATEAYYQKLDGIMIAPGATTTVYFDNLTDPGHFPENKFSIYRTSPNQVDFQIQVSAAGAKIATATATKATGTGEQLD